MTQNTSSDALLKRGNFMPLGFKGEAASVNGTILDYLIGGSGDALVLIHGWPQTWYEWRHVMPALAEQFTVIVPNLPGVDGSSSSVAAGGYDAVTMAGNIYALIKILGFRLRLALPPPERDRHRQLGLFLNRLAALLSANISFHL